MPQTFSIPYKSFPAGAAARPYLYMTVTGINGKSGLVVGIVDSGADTTSLPYEYATLMGYTTASLAPETFIQVGGTAGAQRATAPSKAVVPEIPAVEVEIRPLFVPGAQVALWGRQDFMARFSVAFFESEQRFTITPT